MAEGLALARCRARLALSRLPILRSPLSSLPARSAARRGYHQAMRACGLMYKVVSWMLRACALRALHSSIQPRHIGRKS